LLLLVVVNLPVSLLNAQQKQFNWRGELGYDFLSTRFNSDASTTEHLALLNLNAAGYLYQPWFATLDGGIGLFFRQSESADGDATGDNIYGNATLRLFPQSRFPLEVFAEKTNSRTDTDLTALEIDRTRYGFNQRYTLIDGTAFYFAYERTELTNVNSGINQQETREDLADLLKASFNKTSGAHTVSFDANVNRVARVDNEDVNKTSFATLRHAYRPSAEFSSEDMLTFNQSDIVQEASEFKSDLYQLNSFAFWRPRSNRSLRITGAVRALTSTTQNQANESDAQTASGTLGATYNWSPRWLYTANLGLSNTSIGTDDTTSTFQDVSAAYTSKTYKPYDFDTSWFAQLDLRNTDDDDMRIQQARLQTGYNLNRAIIAEPGRQLSFNGSQSVSATVDSEDFNSQTLFTSLSLNWNQRSGTRSSMARFSLSDSRTIASGDRSDEVEGEFQLINLQASIDNKLSSRSAIVGNVTVQSTRYYRPHITGDEENGDWSPTATLDVSYYKIAVFNVPRLSFHTTLRFINNSYVPVVGSSVGDNTRDDKHWENRLEYTVGLLQFRAIVRFSEIQQEKQSYYLLQVRRMLGGY
jgi:hypothetical protein